MGSWGSGNFDNDAARDHLFELTRDLAQQVEQALDAATSLKLKEPSDDAAIEKLLETVVPNIEIMCVLHESLGGGFLPVPEAAEEWQSRFDQLLNSGHSFERRQVIQQTFDRLRRFAQQCWGDE